MQSEKAPLEAKARVTNPRSSYKDSWIMENNNASSMFNNNNSTHENSFMGDNSSTIVTSPQEKTMNITSPNSSDIDHNIHCLTLPPSTGERTYANTGYFSMTSLGLLRSLVKIPVLLATNS
jgi:hypothetical protein